MKLILDEMIRRSVAEQLRSRGYDVLAVTEQESLRGLPLEVFIKAGTPYPSFLVWLQ